MHTVLAHEKYDVGQRANGGDLDEPWQRLLAAGTGRQGLDQLQGHANAGEVLVGIAAVPPLGVDDRHRRRQLVIGLVVVCDDQVDPEFLRATTRLDAADAAVDRHDDVHTFGVQALDRGRLQPVPVAQPLGDEVHYLTAEQFERSTQDDRRRDAVHVVIAMHGNAFTARNGRLETCDRLAKSGESEGIVEMIERGREEPRRVAGLGQTRASPASVRRRARARARARGDRRRPCRTASAPRSAEP